MLILRWQKEEINWCGHDFVEYFTIVFRITYYFSLNDFFVYIVWNWPYFSNFLFVNLFFASQRINFTEIFLSVWLTNNQLIFTWFESFLSPCRLFIKWKTRYKPVSWCISLVFKNFDQKYVLWYSFPKNGLNEGGVLEAGLIDRNVPLWNVCTWFMVVVAKLLQNTQ